MNVAPPIDVETLPPASFYLNYPRSGPPVGTYLGPNAMGEYFTVVTTDVGHAAGFGARVGLAVGCYTINGDPTDPDALPPAVALAKLQRDFSARKSPPIVVPERAGKPTHLHPPVVNDPADHITVTDA